MKRWVMEYIEQSLLFKLGLLNLLWIFTSILEGFFHNPYTQFHVWNYFDLIGRGIESEKHTNEILCVVLHFVLGIMIILSVLYFLSIKYKGLIDVYVIMMSIIMIMTTISLVTQHEDVCMYCGMVLEMFYLSGLVSELSIDRY